MNTIKSIAKSVQEHYLIRFTREYDEYQIYLTENIKNTGTDSKRKWRIVTDFDENEHNLHHSISKAGFESLAGSEKFCRHDMALLSGSEVLDTDMCWPVHFGIGEEDIIEDYPSFSIHRDYMNDTEIEINPFPWFICTVEIYPNADAVKGLMDVWFQKWYYPKKKTGPFLNVIHLLDGPYKENGGEVYHIDFGTAPADAFTDFLHHICRKGVRRIVIK